MTREKTLRQGYSRVTETPDLPQVRWLAGLNHTNGLHYAPYNQTDLAL